LFHHLQLIFNDFVNINIKPYKLITSNTSGKTTQIFPLLLRLRCLISNGTILALADSSLLKLLPSLGAKSEVKIEMKGIHVTNGCIVVSGCKK
jgi:hypothetical protein